MVTNVHTLNDPGSQASQGPSRGSAELLESEVEVRPVDFYTRREPAAYVFEGSAVHVTIVRWPFLRNASISPLPCAHANIQTNLAGRWLEPGGLDRGKACPFFVPPSLDGFQGSLNIV
jgi:hypothetical protein